jgi:hypothetical protein
LLEKCWDRNAAARSDFESIIKEIELLGYPSKNSSDLFKIDTLLEWNRNEWQERGFNLPPELDPNVLPNLHLKTMRTDGTKVKYPEEGLQELVSRMLSFLNSEPNQTSCQYQSSGNAHFVSY